LIAVGWLEKNQSYQTGLVSLDFYNKLIDLLKDPFQPMVSAGLHECSVCQFQAEKRGQLNLFVPYNNKIYVCPELIVHYINAHHYLPPEIFISAAMECPDTRTIRV
jgi:hypothetical protein